MKFEKFNYSAGGLVVWWFGCLVYSIRNHGLSSHDFLWKSYVEHSLKNNKCLLNGGVRNE